MIEQAIVDLTAAIKQLTAAAVGGTAGTATVAPPAPAPAAPAPAAPAPAAPAPTQPVAYTKDQVRAVLALLPEQQAKDALARVGCTRLGEVQPDMYPQLIAAAQAGGAAY